MRVGPPEYFCDIKAKNTIHLIEYTKKSKNKGYSFLKVPFFLLKNCINLLRILIEDSFTIVIQELFKKNLFFLKCIINIKTAA